MPWRRTIPIHWFTTQRFMASLALLITSLVGTTSAFNQDRRVEALEIVRTDPATVRTQAGQWQLTRDDTRWDHFRAEHGTSWQVRWNETTRTPHRVYGGQIPAARLGVPPPAGPRDKAAVLRLAEAVVNRQSSFLGVGWEDLRPVFADFKGGRWVVTLQQEAEGLEVVGGRVDLRFSSSGDLMLFGSDAYPVPRFKSLPRIGLESALRAARTGLPVSKTSPRADVPGTPELVLLPLLSGEPLAQGVRKASPRNTVAPGDLDIRLAYRVRVSTQDPPGDWMTYVDAATAQVLWRYNRVRFANVTGTVTGDIHPLLGTDPPTNVAFPDQQVYGGEVASTVVSYDFETGPMGWTADSPWALSSESTHGGILAWSDSPGTDYTDNLDISITSPTIDIGAVTDPVLVFWTRNALEYTWDFLYVEASGDDGTTWHTLRGLSVPSGWQEEIVDLEAVEGTSTLRVRFRLSTDVFVVDDGCWVDDVSIASLGSNRTDATGAYSLTTTGAVDPIRVDMQGPFVRITNLADGTTASGTGSPTANVFDLDWDDAISTPSERDVFYGTQIAHQRLKQIDPGFTALDYPLPVYVDSPSYCNAYWGGSQVVFGAGVGICANLGTWIPVMHHEYAHGITDLLYSPVSDPPGDMHEGFSDYFASTITGDPRVGPEILGPGTTFRTIDNKLRDPEDRAGEVHHDGTILAGALWDLRELLLPDVALADSLFHFARYGFPYSFEDYYLDLLTVDDDDANLGNGTPHQEAIRSAFGFHGIGMGPEFQHVKVVVQDGASGNGDGRLDPGEQADLLLSLHNYGGAETDVYAKLSTTEPGVTVFTDSVFVGNVGATSDVTASTAFQIQVDGTVTVGTALVFDLELRSSVGFNGDCFMVPVGYVPILLVDDDRGRNVEDLYTDTLDRIGKGYTRWVASVLGSPTAEEMACYRAVVWFTGTDPSTTIAPGDQEELAAYLGAGGNLFVTGEDIGADLWAGGTAADIAFYETWLHAEVDVPSEGAPPVVGEGGDVVGDGLSFTLNGGTSAGNQSSVSSLTPLFGAVPSLRYSNGRIAGLRFDGSYRLLYCGFGFEGVTTDVDRDSLMSRALAWLCPAEDVPPTVTVVQPNGGEVLTGASTYTIEWTALDAIAVLSVDLFFSSDGGNNYTLVAADQPNSYSYEWTVNDVSSDSCRIRIDASDPSSNVGTDASDADFSITATTDVADGQAAPRRYVLHPAVPNPFNPTTRLRFDLPHDAEVWLEILSVDGRKVRTLLAGQRIAAGFRERVWDGRDGNGRTVAAGVYLARLRAGRYAKTQKVQLVK